MHEGGEASMSGIVTGGTVVDGNGTVSGNALDFDEGLPVLCPRNTCLVIHGPLCSQEGPVHRLYCAKISLG